MDGIKQDSLSSFNFKRYLKKEFLNFCISIAVVVLFILILTKVLFINANIPSRSMQDTINPYDRVIVNRLSYIFEDPKRGDIVVFKKSAQDRILYTKRIVGLPNEKVESVDGLIFINGNVLKEEYAKGIIARDFKAYTIPPDGFFLLGDNRINSLDSRHWKHHFLSKSLIVGRVIFKYYPNIELL